MMRDRQYLSPIGQLDVHDVVGEPAEQNTSDVHVSNAGHRRPSAWSCPNPRHDALDRTQEVGGCPGGC